MSAGTERHGRVGRVFEAHHAALVGLEDSTHPTRIADITFLTLNKRIDLPLPLATSFYMNSQGKEPAAPPRRRVEVSF